MQTSPRTDLRILILGLALAACIATLLNCVYAAYRVGRQTLIENALESNRAYSARVATSIDEFLRDAQRRLKYSAAQLADRFDDAGACAAEVNRLQGQDRGFDAVLLTGADGRVRASSPAALGIDGREVDSMGAEAALRERKPLVSDAFVSIAGNLVVFISVPVFDRENNYLGYLGGSLHLQNDSTINALISRHFKQADAEVYVVDTRRRLVHHPVRTRIGAVVGANPAIDASLRGQDGSVRMIDSQGRDVLSGFAHVPTANWAIVTQQPLASALAPLQTMLTRILVTMLPLAAAGFVAIWALSVLIARPLRQLADNTIANGLIDGADRIAAVRAWYFEASSIKQALLSSIRSTRAKVTGLKRDSQIDALTGLLNRRAMDEALARMEAGRRPLAIVALDIDHFKKVNDTFGHDVGDQVLQRLAERMRACSRDTDLPCRMGGEEFLLLMPDTALQAAVEAGERLRRDVEQTDLPDVGHITISLGVTTWPRDGVTMAQALKEADELMYQAKREGRNRLVAAG